MNARRVFPLLLVVLAGAVATYPGSSPSDGSDSDAVSPRFHEDPEGVEQAVLEATLALLREDLTAARRALDRVERGCARLTSDDDPRLPGSVIAWDQGFHRHLDTAREMALRGDLDRMFDAMDWLQRGCVGCHRRASEEGLRPPPNETSQD